MTSSEIRNPQSAIRNPLAAVMAAVRGFGLFRKRWAVAAGLAWFVIIGPGSLLAWFALDWAVRLPAWPLLGSFALAVLAALATLALRVVPPGLRRVRIEKEALLIESLHGGLDNQLIGALQLGHEVAEAEGARDEGRGARGLGYAEGLVVALVERTARVVDEMNVRRLLDLRRARRLLRGAAATALACVLCLVLARGAVMARIERLRDAWAAALDSLFPVTLVAYPGDVAVVRGRPVTLRVEAKGARRRAVTLVCTDAGTKQPRHHPLELSERKASFTVPKADESFTYRFDYAGRKSAEHTVTVGDLPTVSAIHYELGYPAYTGQAPRTLVGYVARLQGLVGTDVLVSFAATTDLHPDHCRVEWLDGSWTQVSVNGRFGHFSVAIARPDRATLHLTGACGPGFEMERPLSFEIATQADDAPTVQVLLRNRKLTMMAEEAAAFALGWVAEDDFGVAEVTLDYKAEGLDPLLGRPVRQGSVSQRFDPPRDRVRGRFADLFKGLSPPLEPGDRITLNVAARDNNSETGPRTGRAQPVEIVIVRPDLAAFAEKRFGFDAQALLGGLVRIKRETDLLAEPVRTVRTEPKHEIARHDLKARVADEAWPSGSEDAVGDYFRLLSGAE
ncbi:MAG: hypothetical protein FJ291_15240 [Planctomycetes bacterium]|nr:hypothetical protein [Planctomycetota bacterium]